MKYTEYNDLYGRNEFGREFTAYLNVVTGIQSLAQGDYVSEEAASSNVKSKLIQQFLDSPMDDGNGLKLKKLYAAAMTIAQSKSAGNLNVNNAAQTAVIIDDALTRFKVSYLKENGTLNIDDAIEYLVDRTTARAVFLIDKVIDKGVPVVLTAIGNAVAAVCPPAAPVGRIIQSSARFVTPAVKQAVHRGVSFIAEKSKSILSSVASSFVSIGQSVRSKVKNWF